MKKFVFEVKWIEDVRDVITVQISRVNAANIKGACSQVEQRETCAVVLGAEMLTGHSSSDCPVETVEQYVNVHHR